MRGRTVQMTVDKTDTIGKRMRAWREARGHTLKGAAEMMGVNQTTLVSIEVGKQHATQHVLEQFVEVYHVDAHWLLTGKISEPVMDKIATMECYVSRELNYLTEQARRYAEERQRLLRIVGEDGKVYQPRIESLGKMIEAVNLQIKVVTDDLKSLYNVNIEPLMAG